MKMIENGQIATQYVDSQGILYDILHNPNGSFELWKESLVDSRILKNGHSEELDHMAKNVPGERNKIFEAGYIFPLLE